MLIDNCDFCSDWCVELMQDYPSISFSHHILKTENILPVIFSANSSVLVTGWYQVSLEALKNYYGFFGICNKKYLKNSRFSWDPAKGPVFHIRRNATTLLDQGVDAAPKRWEVSRSDPPPSGQRPKIPFTASMFDSCQATSSQLTVGHSMAGKILPLPSRT